MMKCRMLPAPTHSPPSSYFSPITGLRNEEIHASRCGALVARPSPHAELRTARLAGISTRKLVWLDSQAERMACDASPLRSRRDPGALMRMQHCACVPRRQVQWICAADRGADGSGAGEDSPDARPDGDRGVRGLEQTVGIESTLIANAAFSISPSRHLWQRHQNMGVPMKDWGGVSDPIPECGVMLAG